MEILLLDGNIEELQGLKPLKDNLIKLTKQKSPLIRKSVMKVFKEAYLWMGDKINPIIEDPGFDKAGKSDFDKYVAGVMSSDMKVGK